MFAINFRLRIIASCLFGAFHACADRSKALPEDLSLLQAKVKANQVGMNFDVHSFLQISPKEQAGFLNHLQSSGVSFARVEYNAFDFSGKVTSELTKREQYLQVLRQLQNRGIRILLLLDYMSYDSYGRPLNDGTLDYEQSFRQFVPAAVALLEDFYRRGGVRRFQIWNEPNYTWRVTPRTLAGGLHKIYSYVRSHLPDAQIVVGGIESSIGNNIGGRHPIAENYVKELYHEIYNSTPTLLVNGSPPFDAMAIHPYHWAGNDLLKNIDFVLLDTMRKFGDSRSKVWLTEVGSQQSNDSLHWQEIDGILQSIGRADASRLGGISLFTFYYFDRSAAGYHYGFMRDSELPRLSLQRLAAYLKQ